MIFSAHSLAFHIVMIFAYSMDVDRFDTLMVFLKEFFNDHYEKKSANAKSMQITEEHAKR